MTSIFEGGDQRVHYAPLGTLSTPICGTHFGNVIRVGETAIGADCPDCRRLPRWAQDAIKELTEAAATLQNAAAVFKTVMDQTTEHIAEALLAGKE